MQKNKMKVSIITISLIAVLVAIQVILSRFLSIPTPITKISLGFIPICFTLHYLGRFQGIAVAGLGDFIGSILFPTGAYFPPFTLTAILRAFILSVFITKKSGIGRISAGILLSEIICSLGFNTLWLAMLTGDAFVVLLPARITQTIFMSVVQITVLYIMFDKTPALGRVQTYIK